jgi:glycosyltransferase involved in cell wall biosynthesis
VVLDSHLCYFNLNPYSWLKRRYYSVHKNFLLPRYRDQIKALLPQTPDSGKLLMAELGVKEDEMVQITLGTDTDQFRPDLEGGKRVRSRFGLGEEVPVIVFVGRVVPEKRIETIIEALGVPELSESHLMIVGPVDDAYRGALLSGVSDTVKDRIIFTGGVDHEELPAYFSAADVGVWPGDGAISIIDAMACGLPVVVSRLDSSSHLISSGNGEAFDQGDSGELSRVLHGIISDADRRSKMSGLSMTAVENIFDWRRVAGRTLAIYDDVLSDRPSSVPTIW